MRSDLLLACISGPLLAVFLLKGKARRLLAAVFGGMLIAFFAGAISGFLAELVRYDAMAAVLYISPAVEEGLKLILFLLFLFVCQLEDAALPDVAVGIGVGFAMMESIALQYTAGDIGAIALFARAFCSALIHVACALMLILAGIVTLALNLGWSLTQVAELRVLTRHVLVRLYSRKNG